MSAAEPAMPTPPPTPHSEDAKIIPLHPASSDRRYPMPTDPETAPAPTRDRHAQLLLLANDLEMSFNGIGRTLTDPETAAVFMHALEIVARTHCGATAQEILTEEQRQELAVLFDGLRDASRLV